MAEEPNQFEERRASRVADRDNDYTAKRLNRIISPVRHDPFSEDATPKADGARTYKDVMEETVLERKRANILANAELKRKREEEEKKAESDKNWDATPSRTPATSSHHDSWDATPGAQNPARTPATSSHEDKWDNTPARAPRTPMTSSHTDAWEGTPAAKNWDATPGRWDATPSRTPAAPDPTPSRNWDATPVHSKGKGGVNNRWDVTPMATPAGDSTPASVRAGAWDATPTHTPRVQGTPLATPGATPAFGATPATPLATPSTAKKRSRWDETPAMVGGSGSKSVSTPGHTPKGTPSAILQTPSPAQLLATMTPDQLATMRLQAEIDSRNRPLSDEDLDRMLPGESEGFEIIQPPKDYHPIHTPHRKLTATPTPLADQGFFMSSPSQQSSNDLDIPPSPSELPISKPEDFAHFHKLLEDVDENDLSSEELKERKIMTWLLQVKNGTPIQRKNALRHLTTKARELGAGPLFNQILPLLMSPTLEDQERHYLVKVIDRVLFKLDDLVRPYVHKILVVIEPLLIDEDYYARVEGREIISNLAKAAGLATMIATMRPDIDNVDEYVRNTTARAFAVVASALGIHSLLPFLKAVCQSKRSWQARHTGIKIIQQISILMGCAILPHLRSLVEIMEHGLVDEQSKVRCICALALSALAEAAAPYGIESFDSVLRPLWKGIRTHRGKTLAAFLKAIGYIIPLMDASYANYYTREVMVIVIREFATPDEEMKKIVLKVVKQCVATEGVDPDYVKKEILPEFFRHFWIRRMALDRRNYAQVVETTVELANKVGGAEIISRIVEDLKDESEPYRKMVMETIEQVMAALGGSDVDSRLEELLIDGILYAFQEQTSEDTKVMLNGFGVVVNALGARVKPYLPQVCGIIKWRLNNKAARVRQQAADLIARIAHVMKKSKEEQLLGHLGLVLYEYLGEEYPEVLGSILGAIKCVVNALGMEKMTPPIKDLLPRLTPVLKNRHPKVQENCIDLVGRIADRGAEHVPAKEWMRICFELLDMLKAHEKSIRRATVNTFGYIAKAIGPQDVLATLLSNLKVQERQDRVCTTVAIAIVAETCSPFTVLPALMNEYRTPELNVQNGVLKALSFLFEYIGEMGKDYIYAVTPLLEDALMDRDLVHRQIASNVVKHMGLGCAGLSREDALVHLMNYVWPNIFETSPHVIGGVTEAIEALRISLGPTMVLQYTLQGLFHPARKVRRAYWKVFNSMYLGSQDALVPAYPRLQDDALNSYRRFELEMFM